MEWTFLNLSHEAKLLEHDHDRDFSFPFLQRGESLAEDSAGRFAGLRDLLGMPLGGAGG